MILLNITSSKKNYLTLRYNKSFTHEEMDQAADIANAKQFIDNDEIENESKNKFNFLEKISNDQDNENVPLSGKKAKKEQSEDEGTGYQRKVGMKGTKLSGGQKQRVAIARTVIRKPKIYFFDEATSALDTQSEKLVQDALNKIATNSTSLAIAHRISTIRDCDVIFVIKDGKVVEQGSYDQLQSNRGEFYALNQA